MTENANNGGTIRVLVCFQEERTLQKMWDLLPRYSIHIACLQERRRQLSEFGLNKDQLHTHKKIPNTPQSTTHPCKSRQRVHFSSSTLEFSSLTAARHEIYFTRLCSQGIPSEN